MGMTYQPKLLLADEPTSALDVTTQAQIVRQMMKLRDDYHTGIIVVTHNLGVAAYMSDYIVVMKNGKMEDQGTREYILKESKNEYTRKLLVTCFASSITSLFSDISFTSPGWNCLQKFSGIFIL